VNETLKVSVADVETAARRALISCNVRHSNARAVAHSIMAAERDGQPIVGLSYLPVYCDHAACGKVDGQAEPELQELSSICIRVDAKTGFAHPAIALGIPELTEAARAKGIAALLIRNSYACGSLGYFVEQLADHGLVALMVANASPSIAAYGAKVPFFGTNPLAFACPRIDQPPLVIDQSTSVVAKVVVTEAQRRGIPLQPGWALDHEGQPTLDAEAALSGSLRAIGGYKGVGLALMIDVLAGALTASKFSYEASSFGDCEGGPPGTGQFIIAFDPALMAGPSFLSRTDTLFRALQHEPNARLPGERRLASRRLNEQGVDVSVDLWMLIQQYVQEGSPLQKRSHSARSP
jgi:(2R)-3-sulfolactate dehydrogenase (NADP+)